MAHLRHFIFIAAPAAAVFGFHADPRNIERVATPPMQVKLLEPYDVPLRLGSIVRLRGSLLGLAPQLVESEIVCFDPPYEMADEQRRGPFRAWRHRHLFREVPGGTELTDDVEYEPPTALPYCLLGAKTMTEMMESLVARRQELTKQLIEKALH